MLRVRDLMTADVLVLAPELGLREAAEMLIAHHVGGAPVVAAGLVLGVLSTTDVASFTAWEPGVPTSRPDAELDAWEPAGEWEREGEESPGAYFTEWWADAGAEAAQRFADTATPEWDVLAERVVADVMTRSVCAVGPDDDVAEAARRMMRAGVHRLLVLDGHRLLGILAATDLVRAVADYRLIPGQQRRPQPAGGTLIHGRHSHA